MRKLNSSVQFKAFMRFYLSILFVFVFSILTRGNVHSIDKNYLNKTNLKLISNDDLSEMIHINKDLNQKRPSPLLKLFRDKQKRNQKITASILAFPFPFGIVGLHRIYLGCPPYIPVVYIGTLGGVFGALPLIDFFVILIDKNTENYVNNPQVFMWIK